MIDHKKVLVVALNGPAVGGGAVWFVPVADIVLCADNAYLAVPFSALGLVPELGSAQTFLSLLGPQRTNEFLMFGRKLSAQELEDWGIVARVLPQRGFQDHVMRFLEEKLDKNDGKSMMEAARLVKMSLRNDRILAAYNSIDALSERFATGAPQRRFRDKAMELQGELLYLKCWAEILLKSLLQPKVPENHFYKMKLHGFRLANLSLVQPHLLILC